MKGKELRLIRIDRLKLKQSELARLLGIVQDTLCRWELRDKGEKEVLPSIALAVEGLMANPGLIEAGRTLKRKHAPRIRSMATTTALKTDADGNPIYED